MTQPVAIPGLAALRRDMRAIDRGAQVALRKAEAKAAEVIAADARGRAPRGTAPLPPNRTKRLADTIRPMPSGNRFYVGAPAKQAPHGGVVHWGGTIDPRGVPIHFPRRTFLLEAFDAKRAVFVELLGAEIENLARRSGWR
ncbi:MAG: hypothetical protein M3N95_17925 [Actinomycetota bacterium]|nr:hypothetical protein [Actinomycetota bacterium]